MAKNPTCQVCNRNPQANLGNASLVTRAGSRACVECAKKTQCAPVSIKLHLPTREDGSCFVIVAGQCPWCPIGQEHAHTLAAGIVSCERIVKPMQRIGDTATCNIEVPTVWHMNLNA